MTLRNLNKVVSIVFVAGWVVWATPTPSHAYLDAGSGNMMVQLFLAGTAGFAVLLKLHWQQLVDRVKLLLDKVKS